MPQNRKERSLFTLLMAGMMVLGMTIYTQLLQVGVTAEIPLLVLKGYFPVLALALFLDVVIVGPIAKKIAFSLPFTLDTPLKTGIAISCCMVSGMVFCMSLFGLTQQPNFMDAPFETYGKILGRNALIAFPLQLLLVGPLARKLLARYQFRQQGIN